LCAYMIESIVVLRRLAGMVVVLCVLPAYSGTDQQNIVEKTEPLMAEIRYQDALAVKCHDGHGVGLSGPPECDRLQVVTLKISGKLRQLFSTTPYFFLFRDRFLFSQLDECANLGIAGNEELAVGCKTELLNAHDFLTQLALGRGLGNPSLVQWIGCSSQLESNLEMGARCIVAARDMVPCRANLSNPNGVNDYAQCMSILTDGDWTANPKALRIRFDAPRADAHKDYRIAAPLQ
jgi:hypothetical protein